MTTTRSPSDSLRRAFTLIELLVVMTLIGVAIAMLMPAISASREAARKMQCSNNLKQLGLSLQTYHEVFGRCPPNGLYFWRNQSHNNHTWFRSSRGSPFVKLLPYLDQNPLYLGLDFESSGKGSWKLPHFQEINTLQSGAKLVRSEILPFLLCPSANIDPYLMGVNPRQDPAMSCYGFSIGAQRMSSRNGWCSDYPGNVFGTGAADHANDVRPYRLSGVFARGHWAASFAEIEDGQSQVIVFGEILPHKSSFHANGWAHFNGLWTSTSGPLNYPVRGLGDIGFVGPGDCGHWQNLQTSQAFRSNHRGGANFVLADGSVQFFQENIDYMVYQRLGDRRDGEGDVYEGGYW